MSKFDKYYIDKYDDLQYILDLPIGGYSKEYIQNIKNFGSIYENNPSILKQFKINNDEFIIINKLFPHAKYDLCVMSTNTNKSSLSDFEYTSSKELFEIINKFIQYVSEDSIIETYGLNNGSFHMSFNYDPYTYDRESSMSIKSFHMHLNYFTDIEKKGSECLKIKDLESSYQRQRLIDPINEVATSICYDLNPTVSFGEVLIRDDKRDEKEGLPVGYKIKVDSWHFLSDEKAVLEILNILKTVIDFYPKLYKTFTGTSDINTECWKRETLRNKDEIKKDIKKFNELSNKSVSGLIQLIDDLENISKTHMDIFKNNKTKRIKHLSLNGMCFTFGMYSKQNNSSSYNLKDHDDIYVVIQFKMFADVGGTGNAYFEDKSAVMLNRGAYEFTEVDVNERIDFMNGFIEYIK